MTASQRKRKKSFSGRARRRTDQHSSGGTLGNQKVLNRISQRILLVVNIIFGITLLIAYISVHINPEDFAFPAFFGLAYPYLLLINIIIIILWAMMLRYEAFISLVIILLGWNHFTNYIQLFRSSDDRKNTFKVMSYNVRMFNLFEKVPNSQKQVYNLIKLQRPDIFCLQEFYSTTPADQAADEVNEMTGLKYFSYIKLLGSGKDRYYGIATFSRYPIIRKGDIVHPGSSSLSTFVDVVIRNDTIRVYNNHLQSFRLKRMERSFLEEIAADDESIGEMKNLTERLKKGFVNRALQAQVVKAHVKKSPYPVIITGDFNDTPVSYAYRKIRKGLNDSFVNSGYGAGFTYRGNYPPNRIDYILYDNKLMNSWFQIVKVRYSDHYPIIAWFKKTIS